MNEAEYDASPPGLAYRNFHAFTERVLQLTTMARTGIGMSTGLIKILGKLSKKDDFNEQIAQFERIAEDPLIHSMAIMAAWGAFDAFIDDFCKGVMIIDPSILDDKQVKGRVVKVSDLLAPPEVKLDLVYEAIKSSIDTRKIEERIDQTLGFLNLDTPQTAPSITEAFVDSYKIRNVWAHSAGRADKKFVKEAQRLNYKVGDEVALTLEDTAHYVGAILYYGLAINNRLRLKYKLYPQILTTDAVGGKFQQDFMAMYPQFPFINQDANSRREPKQGWGPPGWWAETPEETARAEETGGWTTKDPLQPPTEDSAPGTSPSESGVPPESPAPQSAEEPQAQTSSPDSTQDQTQ